MRVLIVDDEATARLILSQHLLALGPIDEAENSDQAIDLVRAALAAADPYGVICLDICMPGRSGLEVLPMIRELEREFLMPGVARIIMTTTINDRETVLTAFKAQSEGYLLKPIDHTRLAYCLAKHGIRLPPPSGLTQKVTVQKSATTRF